jgi:hypothetical protein
MTDFRELAKNMRSLLQEAKLSSLAVSHFIQPPRHRRSTRCISAPRRRHQQVRAQSAKAFRDRADDDRDCRVGDDDE